MADVLSYNLTNKDQPPKLFRRPDLSTKLKLLGVNVASFGDFFADRDGPKFLPGRRALKPQTMPFRRKSVAAAESEPVAPPVKALTYKDPFAAVYKKYIFTLDGKYLLGGMMIGDTKDYIKLNQLVKTQKKLEYLPSELILGVQNGGEENADDLWVCPLRLVVGDRLIINRDDDTQICSCHNVSKGDVVNNVKNGTCKTIGEIKSCTKAGNGCGGCMPLVQSIFNKAMKDIGQEVSNHCEFHTIPLLRALLTADSMPSFPILASGSLQHHCREKTEDIRRCYEVCRE